MKVSIRYKVHPSRRTPEVRMARDLPSPTGYHPNTSPKSSRCQTPGTLDAERTCKDLLVEKTRANNRFRISFLTFNAATLDFGAVIVLLSLKMRNEISTRPFSKLPMRIFFLNELRTQPADRGEILPWPVGSSPAQKCCDLRSASGSRLCHPL